MSHSRPRFGGTGAWRLARIIAVAAVALLAVQLSQQVSEADAVQNRESCSAIAGTRYHSHAERDWYETNCLSAAAVASTPNTTAQQFMQGYRQAGGPEAYLSHILNDVIPCESGYDSYAISYGGPYYGLMQFQASTWYSVGGGDWFSPWQQGYNTAMLLKIAYPGSQWPYCWFV